MIFNMINFDNDNEGKLTRKGAESDEEKLTNLFKSFNYNVVSHRDKKVQVC